MTNNAGEKLGKRIPWGKAIALALILVSCLAAFSLGLGGRSGGAANKGLVIEEEWLNIGEVYEDEAFHWRLRIANPTEEDVQIAQFATTCTCTQIEPSNLVVAARTWSDIELTIDLARAMSRGETKGSPFELGIVPKIGSGTMIQRGWKVHGVAKYVVAIEPEQVLFNFPLVKGNQYQAMAKHVKITPDDSVAGLQVAAEPDHGVVEITKTGKGYELAVVPKPDLDAGPFDYRLVITGIAKDGTHLPAKRVRVRGEIVEPIRCLPTQLHFGCQPCGTVSSDVVALTAADGEPFELTGFESTLSGVGIQPLPRGDGGGPSAKIRITQQIVQVGHATGEITFHIKRGERQIKLSCPISYYGAQLGGHGLDHLLLNVK